MDVNLWGSPFWFILHTITLNYPDNPTYTEKRHHFDFFNSLQYILPCDVCRDHYRDNFKQNPINSYLDNKKSLIEWGVIMHNSVNKMTGKPPLTSEDVVKKYITLYGSSGDRASQQRNIADFLFPSMTTCNCGKDVSNDHSTLSIVLKTLLATGLICGGVFGGYYLYKKQMSNGL